MTLPMVASVYSPAKLQDDDGGVVVVVVVRPLLTTMSISHTG
jgi:hypothetical protein